MQVVSSQSKSPYTFKGSVILSVFIPPLRPPIFEIHRIIGIIGSLGFPSVCESFAKSELLCTSRTRETYLKGPCTQIVYTLAPKYLHRYYFKAKVYTAYTIWVHGPMRLESQADRTKCGLAGCRQVLSGRRARKFWAVPQLDWRF